MRDNEELQTEEQEIKRKFGKCAFCGREQWLWFSLGSYRGRLWCGWLCTDCIAAAQEANGLKPGNNTILQ